MTEPLNMQLAEESLRQRRLLGWLAPAAVGIILGILLTLVALVVLAPPPHITPPHAGASAPAHATVTVDNAFLTQLSADALSQASLPFTLSNVRVAIHPNNQLAISADAAVGPLTRQLAVTGTLEAVDGQLRLSVSRATIGGLALPSALNAVLASALNAKLATLDNLLQFGGTTYAITSLTTQEGLLTLGLAPS